MRTGWKFRRCTGGDCHTPSGRGFAYFNFSSSSLVKGAMSHKLTRTQGEQIASFIRSQDVPRVRQARPWNPPYQPGPGLDSRPVAEWAAGAGIDAILERDEDTLDYLFPNGTSYDEVAKVVDRYGTLNLRELPVSLAMPHWGVWLPPISPIDAFDLGHEAVLSDEKGNPVSKPYFEVLYEKAKNNPTRQKLDDLFKVGFDSRRFSEKTDFIGIYENNQWYHLQITTRFSRPTASIFRLRIWAGKSSRNRLRFKGVTRIV
jgi:hypothetical protein